MAEQGVQFTPDAARRVVAATKTVEQNPTVFQGTRRGRDRSTARPWQAKVVCAGPRGEDEDPDLTGPQYWVEKVYATNEDETDPLAMEIGQTRYTIIGEQDRAGTFVVGEEVSQTVGAGTATGTVERIRLDDADHDNDQMVVLVTANHFEVSAVEALTGATGSATVDDITSRDHVMVTNKAETITNTHYLELGQLVDVHVIRDETDPRFPRYYITLLPLIAAFYFGAGASAMGTIPVDGMAMILASRLTTFRTAPTQDNGMFFNRFAEFEGVIYGCGEATIDSGGGDVAYTLVRWDEDAEEWVGVLIEAGGPTSLDAINDVIVWDDGGGDALYVCGVGVSNKPVWKFNGAAWSSLDFPAAGSHTGNVLKIWDDGGGEELYCGGFFIGAANEGISRWNAGTTTWVVLGAGLSRTGPEANIHAIESHDDGGGEALYVAGTFDGAAALTVANVARWTGADWEDPGGGLVATAAVRALRSFDDGERIMLYAGGEGLEWTLFAWDGAAWNRVGDFLAETVDTNPAVRDLEVHAGKLVVAGKFHRRSAAGSAIDANHVARFDTGTSTYLEMAGGLNDTVRALEIFDTKLVAGGTFTRQDRTPMPYISQWDGDVGEWSAIGLPFGGPVNALNNFGGVLHAAGEFLTVGTQRMIRLARWNGTAWFSVGDINGPVHAMASGAGNLYIAGEFDSAGGNAGHLDLAKWTGSAWVKICEQISAINGRPIIRALWLEGTDLYVTGNFDQIDSVAAANIAVYDTVGDTWSALDAGIDAEGRSLAVFDSKLYVGGAFTTVDGGTASPYIARWNVGVPAWEAASTFSASNWAGPINAMSVHDPDGGGDKLHASGFFGSLTTAHVVRRFDEPNWSTLGGVDGEISDEVLAIRFGDAGDVGGSEMFIGGRFTPTITHGRPMVLTANYTRQGYEDLLGGCGFDPIGGPIGLNSGQINGATSIHRAGDRCATLFLAGGFRLASKRYGRGLGRATPRGLFGLSSGTDDGSAGDILGGRVFLVAADTRVLMGGNFDQVFNDFIPPEDDSDAQPVEDAVGVTWWNGTTLTPAGTGLSLPITGLAFFEDEYYASSEGGAVPRVSDAGPADVWAVVHASFDGGGEYRTMITWDDGGGELLYIGGLFTISGGSNEFVATWDGAVVATLVVNNWINTRAFLVGDITGTGDALYMCGDASSGSPVLIRSGAGWAVVGANMTGSVEDIAIVGSGSDAVLYACGTLDVDAGTAATVARWSGSAWVAIGGGDSLTAFVKLVSARGALYAAGLFTTITDPASVNPDVETPFLAKWNDADSVWEVPEGGGLNGQALGLGEAV